MRALTDQQVEKLRQQLLAMRLELEGRLQTATRDTRPVSLDQPIGRLTRTDAIQQQHMALGQQQRVEQELQRVDAAVRRLDQGQYGFCLRCRDAIPYERLKIHPTTTLCYECQAEVESRRRKP